MLSLIVSLTILFGGSFESKMLEECKVHGYTRVDMVWIIEYIRGGNRARVKFYCGNKDID
jgi:hypothetical protein